MKGSGGRSSQKPGVAETLDEGKAQGTDSQRKFTVDLP